MTAAAVSGAQTSLDPQQVKEWLPNAVYGGHAFGYRDGKRTRAEEFALALENRDRLVEWIKQYSAIDQLSKELIVNDKLGDTPVLVVFSNELHAGAIWNRDVDGQALTFSLVPGSSTGAVVLRDLETGSHWSGLEGAATSGPLEGTRLHPLTHHPMLLEKFAIFYPAGAIYRH